MNPKQRRPRRRWVTRVAVAALMLGASVLGYSLTASNSISASNASQASFAIGPNNLKPSECSGITLTHLVTWSGVIAGTGGDLVLGSSGIDTITEVTGSNCIVGGAGADAVDASVAKLAGGTENCVISTAATETGCSTVTRRP